MRHFIASISVIIIMLGSFSSCSNSSKSEAAVYQCPMKCEAEKTYDNAGDCPVCGMALEVVKK